MPYRKYFNKLVFVLKAKKRIYAKIKSPREERGSFICLPSHLRSELNCAQWGYFTGLGRDAAHVVFVLTVHCRSCKSGCAECEGGEGGDQDSNAFHGNLLGSGCVFCCILDQGDLQGACQCVRLFLNSCNDK